MKWLPFEYCQKTYDLCHLHPKTIAYIKAAQGAKPEFVYRVEILYSIHCFTREPKPGETPDEVLFYDKNIECRVFDFYRWELSQHLPGILDGMMTRKCFHARQDNFVVVEIINQADKTRVQYEIYFKVSKSSKKGYLNLLVQSAYVRDKPEAGGKRRHNLPMKFSFILHNTLNRIAIKAPQ